MFVVCGMFFFQAEDGIRDLTVTGVQTCAPISLRRLDEREPEPTAQALDGGRGPPGIEADQAAVGAAGIEVAEDKVGVGDGRLRPAEAVTCGPRLGAGAPGPDLERAGVVGVGDRAAAGADG